MASGCAPVARSDRWRYIVESDLRSTNGRGSSGLIDERCQQHDPRRSWHSDVDRRVRRRRVRPVRAALPPRPDLCAHDRNRTLIIRVHRRRSPTGYREYTMVTKCAVLAVRGRCRRFRVLVVRGAKVSWWVPDSCMQTATYALPAIRWTTSTVRIVARLVERRALRDEASRSCGVP